MLLEKIEFWVKKRIIVTSPNGFFKQPVVDNNLRQRHLSGWTMEEMVSKGYKAYGLSGIKILRRRGISAKDAKDKSFLTTIRFSPKVVFFILLALSQPIVYFFPKYAFDIL